MTSLSSNSNSPEEGSVRMEKGDKSSSEEIPAEQSTHGPELYASMAEHLASQPKESLQTWLQSIGAFLVYAATWGLLSVYGTYQSYYETTLLPGSSSNAISWVGTISVILLIMGGVLTGPIYDRGYVRELLLTGSILTIFGIMMTSLATKYWHILLAQGLCVGFGAGILSNPAITLINASFSGNRTLALGLATSGTSIAGIVYPIILSRLMPTVGFAWSTRILGFITLGELIIALAIMLPYTKRAERKTDEATSFSEIFLDKTAFKDPAFLALSVAFFFMWIGYWAVSFFIPTFGEYKVKANAIRSSDFLVISNAVSLGGRLLAVVTSNKFGVPETVPWFALASGALLLGWIGIESIPSFEAWIVLSSLFMSPLAVLCPSMLAHVSPSKDVIGRRMGIAFGFTSVGVLVGTPVASALINLQNASFWRMQVFIGTCMLCGSGCLMYVQREVAKRATKRTL
ncbi:hypothetical protein ACEPPN_012940 [Leptodophora sp. 'Broadleaf-Isolate-01']